MAATADRMIAALNVLAKWRAVLAGWHLGTRTLHTPGTSAMRDLADKWLVMRTENNALTALLIAKGVFTVEEMQEQIRVEAEYLNEAQAEFFAGFVAGAHGITITDPALAAETMKRLGFPE